MAIVSVGGTSSASISCGAIFPILSVDTEPIPCLCSDVSQFSNGICLELSQCGNGIIESPEMCDDNSTLSGDGCSDLCVIEGGYTCQGQPSVCVQLTTITSRESITQTNPQQDSDNNNGSFVDNNVGLVIGVILAGLCVCILIGALLVFLIFYTKKKKDERRSHRTSLPEVLLEREPVPPPTPVVAVPEFAIGDKVVIKGPVRSPIYRVTKLTKSRCLLEDVKNPSQGIIKKKKAELVRYVSYLKEVQIGKRIGGGNFGAVYKGTWNGSDVACKQLLNFESHQDRIDFENECDILKKLSNPGVVQFFGIYKNQKEQEFMILAYVRGGSLLDLVIKKGKHLKIEVKIKDLVRRICLGMRFLEDKNIIHRDLAARNILVQHTEGHYETKITDFGMSKLSSIYDPQSARPLPIKWTAPEIFQQQPYSHSSDVWSYGIVIWEIFAGGVTPYIDIPNREVFHHLLRGNRLDRPTKEMPKWLYTYVKTNLWNSEPSQRPSFRKISTFLDEKLKKKSLNYSQPQTLSPSEKSETEKSESEKSQSDEIAYEDLDVPESESVYSSDAKYMKSPESLDNQNYHKTPSSTHIR